MHLGAAALLAFQAGALDEDGDPTELAWAGAMVEAELKIRHIRSLRPKKTPEDKK